jgi:transcriptional regulator with XRE-family HTH domain
MSKIRSLGYRPMGSTLIPSTSGKQSGRISSRVGDEIRQLRKRQGMTIVELSKRSQQSTGYLSQIERGVSVPSVAAIESIAAALGVRVTWFFEAGEVSASSEGDVVVRKAGRRRLNYANGIHDLLLSPRLNGPVEMFLSSFAPGSGNGEEWLSADSYQTGLVLSGQLRLMVGDKTYELRAGDSFGFNGAEKHRYSNPGKVEARVVWVFTRPAV